MISLKRASSLIWLNQIFICKCFAIIETKNIVAILSLLIKRNRITTRRINTKVTFHDRKIKLLLPVSKCREDPFDYLSSRIIAPAFSIDLI